MPLEWENREAPMKHKGLVAVAISLIWASAAISQETVWQFRWQKDQIFIYQAKHKTNVEEVADKAKVTSASKLSVTKRLARHRCRCQGGSHAGIIVGGHAQ